MLGRVIHWGCNSWLVTGRFWQLNGQFAQRVGVASIGCFSLVAIQIAGRFWQLAGHFLQLAGYFYLTGCNVLLK